MVSIGQVALRACILEATARKPGNVHRFQDFEDTTYLDFLLSAAAIAPALESARFRRVGHTLHAAVQATQAAVRTNTNLGIVLLLAPLAAVAPEEELRTGVERVLAALDVEDARGAYEAIRLAAPAGLGHADSQDVQDIPTLTLREVMALAADRDLVARQYAAGYPEVFDEGVPALVAARQQGADLETAIIACHLKLLAAHPDSLILRKRGATIAEAASSRAAAVLAAGWPERLAGQAALHDLDTWLRADGHRRNPGTTADLVTASLFVALRTGRIQL